MEGISPPEKLECLRARCAGTIVPGDSARNCSSTQLPVPARSPPTPRPSCQSPDRDPNVRTRAELPLRVLIMIAVLAAAAHFNTSPAVYKSCLMLWCVRMCICGLGVGFAGGSAHPSAGECRVLLGTGACSLLDPSAADCSSLAIEWCMNALLPLPAWQGVPYYEAPGEGEAACAALNICGWAHGCHSQDVDALLFGAQTVYRHLQLHVRASASYSGACPAHIGRDEAGRPASSPLARQRSQRACVVSQLRQIIRLPSPPLTAALTPLFPSRLLVASLTTQTSKSADARVVKCTSASVCAALGVNGTCRDALIAVAQLAGGDYDVQAGASVGAQ